VSDSVLSYHDLTVRYPRSEADAVTGASLELGREKIAIVGPNGSGKTALLKAAMGLAPVTSGSVHVLGRDVRTVRGLTGVGTNLEEVYRLMTVSVDGLITIWADLTGQSDEKVRGWIDYFDLHGVLPRPLFRLSTGQAKLVGNLLALAFSPQLLLLDEPFDNVDFGRRRKYIDLLSQSPASVVMNTHELELLHAFPDWGLFLMFEGQLIGRFRAADIDRLYVSRTPQPDALASFPTSIGQIAVTLDHGDVPLKGASNLSYVLDRIA
jgi:ABC-type multidrug transport system ATPase subunit